MIIWIDADSCPRQVREQIFRTGQRLQIPVYLVANHPIPCPTSELVRMILTEPTPDAADDYIVAHVSDIDMVITRDIPFAKRLVDKHISVINDRGIVYTEKNIDERLSLRNFMLELYNNGLAPERTAQYGRKELQKFSNALDRELTRMQKTQS